MSMRELMRICFLIPHYEHAGAIGELLDRLEPYGLPCIVVDDGSGEDARTVLRELDARHRWVTVVWRDRNGGQGAAKRTGYRKALEAGYTHSLELDADGQHDTADIPRFLAAMQTSPSAAVLGKPEFGEDAPLARIYGRQLSRGLVWAACASFTVEDPLCGYRGLPLERAVEVIESAHTGDRMSFDPEFAVRLYRAGLPIVTIPTRVSYPTDGVSHFDMVRDNLRLAGTYVRLLAELPLSLPSIVLARIEAGRLAAEDAGRLAAEDAGRLAAQDAARLANNDAGRLATEDGGLIAPESAPADAAASRDRPEAHDVASSRSTADAPS